MQGPSWFDVRPVTFFHFFLFPALDAAPRAARRASCCRGRGRARGRGHREGLLGRLLKSTHRDGKGKPRPWLNLRRGFG